MKILRNCSAVLLLLWTASIFAQDTRLDVNDAWIPEAPPVAQMHAGYMQLKNNSNKDIQLGGASSDDYKAVEIHKTVTKDGMSRMIRQENLVIPQQGSVLFERGGLHLMLMHPKRKLKAGDQVTIRLKTTDGNDVTFTATVKPATLDDHTHHHHHHH